MDQINKESNPQFASEPVFTIGHSTGSLHHILQLLCANGIMLLIDVRSSPYSRFAPQFNKSVLDSLLKKEGIAYTFLGDYLGGRPTDPTCYKFKRSIKKMVNPECKVERWTTLQTPNLLMK